MMHTSSHCQVVGTVTRESSPLAHLAGVEATLVVLKVVEQDTSYSLPVFVPRRLMEFIELKAEQSVLVLGKLYNEQERLYVLAHRLHIIQPRIGGLFPEATAQ